MNNNLSKSKPLAMRSLYELEESRHPDRMVQLLMRFMDNPSPQINFYLGWTLEVLIYHVVDLEIHRVCHM